MGHEEGTYCRGYKEGDLLALNIVMHSSISCSALSMLALYLFPTTLFRVLSCSSRDPRQRRFRSKVPAGVSKGIKDVLQDLAGLEHPCVVLPRHGNDSINVGNYLGRNVCNVCMCVLCVCVSSVCVCVCCVCVCRVCVWVCRVCDTQNTYKMVQHVRHQHARLSLHRQMYRHTTFLRAVFAAFRNSALYFSISLSA